MLNKNTFRKFYLLFILLIFLTNVNKNGTNHITEIIYILYCDEKFIIISRYSIINLTALNWNPDILFKVR